MKTLFCLFALLALQLPSYGTELAPWYPRMFEIQSELCGHAQYSDTIASDHGDSHHFLHAVFLEGSLGIPLFHWYGEVEVSLAETSHRHFGLDHGTMTGRYQLLDDVSGDSPVSAVVALSVSGVPTEALHDLSSFHHGKFEAITQLAVGKEFSSDQFWSSHLWGVLGIGSGDVGSPWIHMKLCAEKNACDNRKIAVFMDGLFGLGGRALRPHHFRGYGPVKHRSIDMGALYKRVFSSGIHGEIGASYRVYARNFPKNAGSFWVSLHYPFGL